MSSPIKENLKLKMQRRRLEMQAGRTGNELPPPKDQNPQITQLMDLLENLTLDKQKDIQIKGVIQTISKTDYAEVREIARNKFGPKSHIYMYLQGNMERAEKINMSDLMKKMQSQL